MNGRNGFLPTNMERMATLLLAHLLGDFPLQTNRIFQLKVTSIYGIAIHVAIHVFATAVLLKNVLTNWPLLLILAIAHFLTDWIKLQLSENNQASGFILDQIVHILTLALLAQWFPDVAPLLPTWLLYPVLLLALIPALMTFIWVWVNDIQQKQAHTASTAIIWASNNLLSLSQILGKAVLLLVAIITIVILL